VRCRLIEHKQQHEHTSAFCSTAFDASSMDRRSFDISSGDAAMDQIAIWTSD